MHSHHFYIHSKEGRVKFTIFHFLIAAKPNFPTLNSKDKWKQVLLESVNPKEIPRFHLFRVISVHSLNISC